MEKLKVLIARIRELLPRGIEMFSDNMVPVYAGYSTLFIVTAMCPCVVLIISIVNLMPGYSAEDVGNILLQILPDLEPVKDLIVAMVKNLKDQSDGLLASVAAVTTLWSASKGVKAIQKALDQMDHTDKEEADKEDIELKEIGSSAAHKTLKRLFFTVLIIILIPALLIFEMLGDSIANFICSAIEKVNPDRLNSLLSTIDDVFHISSLVVMLFALMVVLQIYAKLPEKQRTLKSQLPGALITLASWFLFTKLFALVIPLISRSSTLYGSLASLFFLLLWLRYMVIILFAGGILNHVLEEE